MEEPMVVLEKREALQEQRRQPVPLEGEAVDDMHIPEGRAALGHHVVPGEVITREDGVLRGHGTLGDNDAVQSTVSGMVERVNRLVSVRALRSRYTAETGDVVVGRIVRVAGKRWMVDLGGYQHAILMLSAIHLPGGVQRRRTDSDVLKMRQIFAEGDLMSAEVQGVWQDGTVVLHTRSLRYGKLSNGQFTQIDSVLVRRVKTHFHTLECGVDVLLGNNGYAWISESRPALQEKRFSQAGVNDPPPVDAMSIPVRPITLEVREKICRVHNAMKVLHQAHLSVYPATIEDVYDASKDMGLSARDMLRPGEVQERLTAVARARVSRVE